MEQKDGTSPLFIARKKKRALQKMLVFKNGFMV